MKNNNMRLTRIILRTPLNTGNHTRRIMVLAGLACGLVVNVNAQDSTKKKDVTITSAFKPTLKEAAKININATPPVPDTTRPRLQYNIPNQNLSFAFQPGTLKPLALTVDSGGRWDNESFVKLGYGTLNTPYVQVGISVGDGKTMGLTIRGKHYSSNGKMPFQDVNSTAIDVSGFFQTGNTGEWSARFGGETSQYNKYGFQPKTLVFPEDSIRVRYQNWRGRVSYRNLNSNELGISYAPEIRVDVFTEKLAASESNTYFNLPLKKTIGTKFEADVVIDANLTRYKPQGKTDISNNFFSIAPSVLYKSGNLFINAGIRPSWNNGTFLMLPNVFAEVSTSDKRVSLQAGWLGYLRNSGYQYIATLNPWIWAPDSVFSSRVEERYAGLKGSIGDHFSYGAKVSYNTINDQPLFINDTVSGKSFLVVNEPEMKVFNFGGELGFNVGEKFSIISNLTFNQYSTKYYDKAWGLVPLEFKTMMRLQVIKDLYAHASFTFFDGPRSLTKAGSVNLPGYFDISAGLEFKILRNLKLWAQFNNILEQENQRFYQYPGYGFNFLGGVVFSFAQKK